MATRSTVTETEQEQARAESYRQIRFRLLGMRYEAEEALRETRAVDRPDALLDAHISGALLDAEGAIQRIESLSRGVACTPP